jgi:hypothetical protein
MMLGITMAILDPYHQTQRSQLDEYIDAENSHKVWCGVQGWDAFNAQIYSPQAALLACAL